MSKYDRDIQDVYAVKQLGDAIGYGHLMDIAHELWARLLEDKGLPRRGAHCVVGYPMVKEEYQTEALNDPIYTYIVDKALKADRKTENSSEKPNNCENTDCDTCRYAGECDWEPWQECPYEPKTEPTTEDCSTVPTSSKMEQVDKDINVRSKDEQSGKE